MGDKNTFLSTKLSPVGSVVQSLKRPSSNLVEDDDGGEQLNKKQRVVVIRDPRRRKMEEEKKLESANAGLSLRHISNKLKKLESEEEEEIEEKKWAGAGKEGPHESPLFVRKTMKHVENSVSAAKFYKYRQEREFNKGNGTKRKSPLEEVGTSRIGQGYQRKSSCSSQTSLRHKQQDSPGEFRL